MPSGGEGATSGDGCGGAGDEGFVVGDFFGEEGCVGWGEAVSGQRGRSGGEGSLQAVEEEAGFGEKRGVAKVPPAAAGEVDFGGFGFAVIVVEIGGEGLAEFVGEVFEFGFFAFFLEGEVGDEIFLPGDDLGEGVDSGAELGGFGGEGGRRLVFPDAFVAGLAEEVEHGEVHGLAV